MTAQRWLDRTQAITDQATEGPWEAGRGWVYTDPVYADDRRLSNVLGMSFADHGRQEEEVARGDRNAEFIAHARTALPQAVAALRAVQKVCDDWDQQERQFQADQGATSPHADCIRTIIAETLGEA